MIPGFIFQTKQQISSPDSWSTIHSGVFKQTILRNPPEANVFGGRLLTDQDPQVKQITESGKLLPKEKSKINFRIPFTPFASFASYGLAHPRDCLMVF